MYYQQGNEILTDDIRAIDSICTTSYNNYLFKYPNVVGMARGIKIVKGEFTGVPCISFFVTKKVADLPPDKLLPAVIENHKTDVIAIGEVKAQSLDYFNQYSTNSKKLNYSSNNYSNNNYYNDKPFDIYSNNNFLNNNSNSYDNSYVPFAAQAIGGTAIGAIGGKNRGTLGCVVEDDTNLYILSSNHVLAGDNRLPRATTICKAIKGDLSTSDYIANLSNFTSIVFGARHSSAANRIDAAIAMVGSKSNQDDLFARIIQKGVQGVGDIKGTSTIAIEQTVSKFGSVTNLTNGTVWGVGGTFIVKYNDRFNAIFTNQIITSSMSKSGDSGSLGFDKDNKVFGLLFAGSDSCTLFNPIDDVLSALKVKITL